jgi:hypothetical protein
MKQNMIAFIISLGVGVMIATLLIHIFIARKKFKKFDKELIIILARGYLGGGLAILIGICLKIFS